MTGTITLPETQDRSARFKALIPQLRALIGSEPDPVATMANVTAALMEVFRWHWIGFYRVVDDELVLGPFQGPVACTRIAYGKGVCGTAWKEDRTMLVPDVEQFPGHIACSALSRSEIVVPIHGRPGTVTAVLDIDSALLDDFTEQDRTHLEELCALLETDRG
ncbi:MAG: GAF domain-containing protein [Flavobacteriales bacterium]|nr:GAF domain-containing protein [Flavobacteriales bacterium]MCB9178919.1 GAF domain-containing protein [Flavobacteriales bacterium]